MIIDLTHTITPDTFVYPGTPAPAFVLFAAGAVACMFVPTLHTVADFCYSPAFGYAMFALALALAAAFAAFGAYAKSRRARPAAPEPSRETAPAGGETSPEEVRP